jgi:hypothetical protein
MSTVATKRQQLAESIAMLPDEAVLELANFVDYLKYKLSASSSVDHAAQAPSASILANIAALPLEGKTDGFSGRDHDQVLYSQPVES